MGFGGSESEQLEWPDGIPCLGGSQCASAVHSAQGRRVPRSQAVAGKLETDRFSPETTTPSGLTSVGLAATLGHTDVVDLLLRCCADPLAVLQDTPGTQSLASLVLLLVHGGQCYGPLSGHTVSEAKAQGKARLGPPATRRTSCNTRLLPDPWVRRRLELLQTLSDVADQLEIRAKSRARKQRNGDLRAAVDFIAHNPLPQPLPRDVATIVADYALHPTPGTKRWKQLTRTWHER